MEMLIREIDEDYIISGPSDCSKYLNEFKNQDREHVIILGLDSQNKVIYRDIVCIGILNASIIHPREVFKKAIMGSCNNIIISHNHPSGNNDPSQDDITIHKRLKQSGEILGIKVIDCLIVTKNGITSFDNEV